VFIFIIDNTNKRKLRLRGLLKYFPQRKNVSRGERKEAAYKKSLRCVLFSLALRKILSEATARYKSEANQPICFFIASG
jgi:hypothetical protein